MEIFWNRDTVVFTVFAVYRSEPFGGYGVGLWYLVIKESLICEKSK